MKETTRKMYFKILRRSISIELLVFLPVKNTLYCFLSSCYIDLISQIQENTKSELCNVGNFHLRYSIVYLDY